MVMLSSQEHSIDALIEEGLFVVVLHHAVVAPNLTLQSLLEVHFSCGIVYTAARLLLRISPVIFLMLSMTLRTFGRRNLYRA